MEKEQFNSKTEQKSKFEDLEKFLGENFNPKKTISLEKDLDQKNELKELGEYKAYWTEFINPDTEETVEAKVYTPNNLTEKPEIFFVSPGYKGDFSVQEGEYADDLAVDNRIVVFLRHNGMRTEGEDVQAYIHCNERSAISQEKGHKYLGGEKKFSFKDANREVLTALKALGSKIDEIKKIDIMGHSWGGRIALESLTELNCDDDKAAQQIKEKLDNVILIGAWLEENRKNLEPFREFFESEAEKGFFNNMDANEVMETVFEMAENTKNMGPEKLPKNIRLVGVHSVGDQDIDLEGETMSFFKKMKGAKRLGNIVLKDLKNMLPEKFAGRESETHDYALPQVRKWIKTILEAKREK